jgi:hypothetical protein
LESEKSKAGSGGGGAGVPEDSLYTYTSSSTELTAIYAFFEGIYWNREKVPCEGAFVGMTVFVGAGDRAVQAQVEGSSS